MDRSRSDSSLFSSLASDAADPAVVVDDVALDRTRLRRAVRAYIATLENAGAKPGDRVAVWTERAASTVVALVGNALSGVVSVPLNTALGAQELAHVVRDSRPLYVVSTDESLAERTPSVRALRANDDGAAGDHRLPDRRVDDEPLLLLYTSGTTGAPKGAILTARNVARNLDGLARAWSLTERDRIAHALPLFHVHGLCLGLFGALRAGASLAWQTRFDPASLAASIDRGATVLYAVPTMYHRLVELAERDESVASSLSRARLLVSGSAPLSTREFHRIERATRKQIVERYGLTETLINCAVRSDATPRAGWVGPAVDGVEVELVDDGRARIEARDGATIGEIRVRGENVFAGYWERPDATAKVVDADGWFYTGDLAVMDASGWVRIVGRRATDLIKTGGFKVGAGEVEAALREHPSVLDCAVVGAADDDLGERIVAYVVLREGSERPEGAALESHVAALLSAHKRPRVVRFVDELPRNAMGKVVKAALIARG